MDNRDELIRFTKKGVGFPLAGLLVITLLTLFVNFLPQRQALIWGIVVTGSTFPIAFFISKIFDVNPFAKLPPLTDLGAILAFAQFLYWPVLIMVLQLNPNWFPFVFSVLFGSHFIPYGWLYKSTGYYFIGFSMPFIGCLMALGGSEFSYLYTFASLIPLYVITCDLLFKENSTFKEAVI
jgi:hypothetical protein